MTGNEDGLEAWALPLVRGPIIINAATDPEWLETELGERLEALLRLYNCDASPRGWRDLALRLALEHVECMRVQTPVDRDPAAPAGAEPGSNFFLAIRLRRLTKELGLAKRAAVALADSPRQVKTLQNLAARKAADVAPPRWWQRMPWDARTWTVIQGAADNLSKRSRF